MIIEELQRNERAWRRTVDALGEVHGQCLRAQTADWVSDAATRYRDELADRATEIRRLILGAEAIVDGYVEHVAAVEASAHAALPVF